MLGTARQGQQVPGLAIVQLLVILFHSTWKVTMHGTRSSMSLTLATKAAMGASRRRNSTCAAVPAPAPASNSRSCSPCGRRHPPSGPLPWGWSTIWGRQAQRRIDERRDVQVVGIGQVMQV